MNINTHIEKKKFNIIDLFILISVILIIVTVIFRSYIIDVFSSKEYNTNFEITFVSYNFKKSSYDYLKTTQNVRWLETGIDLGELSSLSKEASKNYVLQSNGTYAIYNSDSEYKITGKINILGLYNQGCYITRNTFVAAGMQITLVIDNVQIPIIITSVKQV